MYAAELQEADVDRSIPQILNEEGAPALLEAAPAPAPPPEAEHPLRVGDRISKGGRTGVVFEVETKDDLHYAALAFDDLEVELIGAQSLRARMQDARAYRQESSLRILPMHLPTQVRRR